MESLRTLLIANRGEIATRILRTAKSLSIRTVTIYTASDASSTHVSLADESVLLAGPESAAYLDADQIIRIAKEKNCDAIIPGYGFLSENAEFARLVREHGFAFAGPSDKCIEEFGIKHRARTLAQEAQVPIVPGSKGLIESEHEAITEATQLGYPVMLKATAGGGGMGLITCQNEDEVRSGFEVATSRGQSLFKNPGVFLERYYPDSHHIEVQIFGNGQGKAIHFGERECSIQRRHQKVIEECPSPFIEAHPVLRAKLCDSAVRLAESINYGSAGTVEYLVDDQTGEFFFLEMNTRLQVEHGITELCYNVDLVELMLKQADAELKGQGGLGKEFLAALQPSAPNGAAIEARIYAENPAKDYAPSPGTLQLVRWKETAGSRVDSWVHTGTKVASYFDPLLAKAMTHAPTRQQAIERLQILLTKSQICGPPTNMDFLACILKDQTFASGKTLTRFLGDFKYSPAALDVVSGGAFTLVEDWPGRPTIGKGFGHSGPMDPVAFRMANLLVGNDPGVEGLEITLSGPDLRFLGPAIVSICGAPFEVKQNGRPVQMWKRIKVAAGDRLEIHKTSGSGCRAYVAIYGGLPGIAPWFGSKSTATVTAVGGYQGRALTTGDMLEIVTDVPEVEGELAIPDHLVPRYLEEWEICAMPGPYDVGFLTDESIKEMWNCTWTVSHNAARGGIRLIGPKPKWAREDGGEGGAHPSNVIEYGYPLGGINWTGDDPVLFPVDAPDFGGFITTVTIIKSDFWKVGQLKAGNKFRLRQISYEDARSYRQRIETFIDQIQHACQKSDFKAVQPLNLPKGSDHGDSRKNGQAILRQNAQTSNKPFTTYRRGGTDFILVEYGHGSFDLNHRCRAVALNQNLQKATSDRTQNQAIKILTCLPCGNSLMIHFDSSSTSMESMLQLLMTLENDIGDLSKATFPSRVFKLPITFSSRKQTDSLQRYMETQRPYASYLPSPLEFVAKNNAMTVQQLKEIFTKSTLMVVAVGFFVALPIALPVDPRQRIQCPKMNPSRVHTPEGQVGWGGSCMALYNVESPGGYMNIGLSIPGADVLGFKSGYAEDKPWLFEDFDQITFYEVQDEDEYEKMLEAFRSGRYEYEYENTVFDMKVHNDLLESTREEVAEIKKKQKEAQLEMNRVEKEMLEKWNKEKEEGKISVDTVEELLNDPQITAIESPLTANVWRINVAEGEQISQPQNLVVLEAMKMEIPVRSSDEDDGATIEKILVKSGDVVDAGGRLVLLRRKERS